MSDKTKIKAFVQGVLGCGCAEEVFSVIEESQQAYKAMPYSRINVGNKLLVHLYRTHDRHFIAGEMKGLVDAGVIDRDNNGFNRFRLVIATAQPEEIRDPAERAFDAMEKDDRTHLHIVGNRQADFSAE